MSIHCGFPSRVIDLAYNQNRRRCALGVQSNLIDLAVGNLGSALERRKGIIRRREWRCFGKDDGALRIKGRSSQQGKLSVDPFNDFNSRCWNRESPRQHGLVFKYRNRSLTEDSGETVAVGNLVEPRSIGSMDDVLHIHEV